LSRIQASYVPKKLKIVLTFWANNKSQLVDEPIGSLDSFELLGNMEFMVVM
jgi:hypothetical protein